MSTDLVHASLFTGIGGLDLGLARAGIHTVAACEIDAHARAVYQHHNPDVPMFDDVTKVTGDDLRAAGFVPDRGVLSAGFPCQDLSVAGRRKGLHGARSGLFWHVVRLAAETRPRWLVLENVPGLLSAVCPCPGDGSCQRTDYARRYECAGEVHPVGPDGCCPGGCFPSHGGVMGTVLGALGTLGYMGTYRVLDAQFFGVPQRRPRVFIVGCARGTGTAPIEILLEPESGEGHPSPSGEAGPGAADESADGAAGTGGRVARTVIARSGKGVDSTPDEGSLIVGTLTKSLGAGGADENRAAVNQIVPTETPYGTSAESPEVAATLVTNEQGGVRTTDISGAYIVREPTPFDATQLTHPENRSNPQPGDPSPSLAATARPPMIAEDTPDVAATVTAKWSKQSGGPAGDETQNVIVQRASLHGRDGGNQLEVGEPGEPADPIRAADGGSSRGMVAVTHALTSEGHDATEDGSGRGTPLIPYAIEPETGQGADLRAHEVTVSPALSPTSEGRKTDRGLRLADATSVRRLTPLECERLQGFPDGYTTSGRNGKPQADGTRYRQLGNAVAVPVVEWIGRRLVAADERLEDA